MRHNVLNWLTHSSFSSDVNLHKDYVLMCNNTDKVWILATSFSLSLKQTLDRFTLI